MIQDIELYTAEDLAQASDPLERAVARSMTMRKALVDILDNPILAKEAGPLIKAHIKQVLTTPTVVPLPA